MIITKLEAAKHQLRVGIELIFKNQSVIAAHTLVGAASVLLLDLLEKNDPEKSFEALTEDANNLSKKEVLRILRESQNFFKHADNDPGGKLDFDPIDTEALAFGALFNLGELDGTLPMTESVFQLWYMASHLSTIKPDYVHYPHILELFGNLEDVEMNERRRIGLTVLTQELMKLDNKSI